VARSLPLKAYLALRGADDRAKPLPQMPPRPKGSVIWARCRTADQARAIDSLRRALQADGDPVHLTVTMRKDADAALGFPEPVGKDQIKAFLDHWKPAICLWVGDELDPFLLNEMSGARRRIVGIDMSADVLRLRDRNWIPGLPRAVLGLFHHIGAVDTAAAAALVQAGIRPSRIAPLGPLAETPVVLTYREADRRELARAIGTRPSWLAAAAGLEEADLIAVAHQQASRRAHRLLLIVSLRSAEDAPDMAKALRAQGFNVALRSDDAEPGETNQVYIVDSPDEIGLCYRLAPITYLAGSLSGTAICRDPYEAAALGSAVLHGPAVAPWQNRISLLRAAGGCVGLQTPAALGSAVEDLLAADKVAAIAHAAWDVTSRGADMAAKLAEMLQEMLDEAGG
jgi:3-deoxy-D-manno-octulosonic-acid transferase